MTRRACANQRDYGLDGPPRPVAGASDAIGALGASGQATGG